jgi:hypothetical protein
MPIKWKISISLERSLFWVRIQLFNAPRWDHANQEQNLSIIVLINAWCQIFNSVLSVFPDPVRSKIYHATLHVYSLKSLRSIRGNRITSCATIRDLWALSRESNAGGYLFIWHKTWNGSWFIHETDGLKKLAELPCLGNLFDFRGRFPDSVRMIRTQYRFF